MPAVAVVIVLYWIVRLLFPAAALGLKIEIVPGEAEVAEAGAVVVVLSLSILQY